MTLLRSGAFTKSRPWAADGVSARVALHTGAVAHEREILAFAAGFTCGISTRLFRRVRHRTRNIAPSRDQSGDRDVLVQRAPMQSRSADLDALALCGRGFQEARKPGERHAKRATVAEVDPHRVIVERDLNGGNGHSRPSGSCRAFAPPLVQYRLIRAD